MKEINRILLENKLYATFDTATEKHHRLELLRIIGEHMMMFSPEEESFYISRLETIFEFLEFDGVILQSDHQSYHTELHSNWQ